MRKHVFWTIAIAAISVLLMFGLAGCGGSDPSEPEAADQTEEVAEAAWYDELLNDPSVMADYPYYRLLDIDQDGVEEIFLSSTESPFIGAEDKAKLMAHVDGQIVTLKEIGGAGGESFSYDDMDRSLFYYSRLSGEEHIIKYTFENGALSEVQSADEYEQNHDPETGDNPDETYYLDGKKVTEDEADVLWDQYEEQAIAISYSADGMGSPYVDDDADDSDDDGEVDD